MNEEEKYELICTTCKRSCKNELRFTDDVLAQWGLVAPQHMSCAIKELIDKRLKELNLK